MRRYLPYILVWVLLYSSIYVSDNPQNLGLRKIEYGYFTKEDRSLLIETYSLGSAPGVSTIVNKNLQTGEKYWLSRYEANGSWGLNIQEYLITYDFFNKRPLSYELVKEQTDAISPVPHSLIQGTKVEIGAFFNPVFSRYGVNCQGCSGQNSGRGNFSVGIGADINEGVRQFDGKYKKGLIFEGYYIVASDPSIPLCTILEISNHNFSGGGLEPGVPFYAVVLDRGGAIKNNRLDFYIGDERYYNSEIKYKGKRLPLATIVAFGKRSKDSSGKRSCRLPKIEELKSYAENQ